MKVRHKRTWMTFAPVTKVGGGYIFGAKGMMRSTGLEDAVAFLPDEQYEEVQDPPPDRWQDVTGECQIDHVAILHGHRHIDDTSYRLRKVRVKYEHDGLGRITGTPYWAFLVERKEE